MAAHLKPSRPLAPHTPKDRSPSTMHELASSLRLLQHLDMVARLETEAERGNREVLLQEILHLFQRWICSVAVRKGLYPDLEAAKEAGGSIFVSGSYKLCINDPDSDIDTICVAPLFVSRDDFFDSFVPYLHEHPGITSILPIRDTAVPIIELEFRGVSFDLQFVALPLNVVPKQLNVLDDNVLQGLDQTAARVLNGPRANELIGMLVSNFDTFKAVLRALRLWAKQRGLYSNKMGFLGGINLSILAAFICQLYPAACPAACLTAFFREFKDWAWPQPVFLTRPYTTALGLPVWDPKNNPLDKWHVMPIITPAYPCMNSSFNVKRSTLAVMMMEIQRGFEVCQAVLASPDPTTHDWSALFAPTDFFLRFDVYLVLEISAGSPEDLLAWKGFVESRIKALVEALENERPALPLSMLYPFPKPFPREEAVAEPSSASDAASAGAASAKAPEAAPASKVDPVEAVASAGSTDTPEGAMQGGPSRDAGASVADGASLTVVAAGGGTRSLVSPSATARMLARTSNTTYAEAEEVDEGTAVGASRPERFSSSAASSGNGVTVESASAAVASGSSVVGSSDVYPAAAGGDNVVVARLLEEETPTQHNTEVVPTSSVAGISEQQAQPLKLDPCDPVDAESTAALDQTAAGSGEDRRTHTVYSYYVGIMLDREKMKGATLNLSRALTDFKVRRG